MNGPKGGLGCPAEQRERRNKGEKRLRDLGGLIEEKS